MIQPLIIILICGILYAIKGGSGAKVFPNWDRTRLKSKILDFVLDGKKLSTIGMMVMGLIITGSGFYSLALGIAWLLAVSPSMGEDHGAVGDYKEAWGEYTLYFDRGYGIKKALQRGIYMGAVFTVFTGFIPFIWASLLFIPCIFVGQSLNRLVLKERGWTLAEPLIGALVIGVPLALWV